MNMNEYLLVMPSCCKRRSNCPGLPRRRSPACICTTSQNTSSSYLSIQNGTTTYFVTFTSPLLFSHCNLYGRGYVSVVSPSCSTMEVLATLVQLPPSTVTVYECERCSPSYFFFLYNLQAEGSSCDPNPSISP